MNMLTLCDVARTCNPSFTTFFDGGSTPNATVTASPDAVSNVGFDWKSMASLVIFIGCVLYSRYMHATCFLIVRFVAG